MHIHIYIYIYISDFLCVASTRGSDIYIYIYIYISDFLCVASTRESDIYIYISDFLCVASTSFPLCARGRQQPFKLSQSRLSSVGMKGKRPT